MEKANGVSHQNVSVVKSKLSTKKDLHLFLCYELDAYVPEQTCVSVYFMKDIINGTRRVSINYFNFFFSMLKTQMLDTCTFPIMRHWGFKTFYQSSSRDQIWWPTSLWPRLPRQWVINVRSDHLKYIKFSTVSYQWRSKSMSRHRCVQEKKNSKLQKTCSWLWPIKSKKLSLPQILLEVSANIFNLNLDKTGRAADMLKESYKRRRSNLEIL